MGIDPGFAIAGYGIVKYEGNKFTSVDMAQLPLKAQWSFQKGFWFYTTV